MLQGKYPLLIALVLGVMAGTIAYSAIQSRVKGELRYWAPARIVCAAQDIHEMEELDESMVAVCEIPARYITESVIRVPDEEEGQDSLIPYGQKALVPLKKGDPLMYSQFQTSAITPLSQAVPRWARAVSVEVSERSAVGRHIQPNDHVDVLATLRDPEGKQTFAMTLLVNEIVLAAGGATGQTPARSDDDRRYTNVTLMVSPKEAEMLALAQELGTLSLSLRHPDSEQDRKSLGKVTDFGTLLTEEQHLYELRQEKQTIRPPPLPPVCRGATCGPDPLRPGENVPGSPM